MPPTSRTHHASPWRARLTRLWPWIFVLGMAAGSALPLKRWLPTVFRDETQAARDADVIVQRAGNGDDRHAIDVLYTIDGDTFGARVHLADGADLKTRIRLRGIDAPELKGQCRSEIRLAENATAALKRLLTEGGVAIYNIGPDKYPGRVVADVATRRTPNVSAALLAGGYARNYGGGHRGGWCDK
ncbi:MAG: thermonuclease family protein [Hyphomicrobiales bacterium]|nr:thermonuclease family protein [Hyphomicrobiales bacterium]